MPSLTLKKYKKLAPSEPPVNSFKLLFLSIYSAHDCRDKAKRLGFGNLEVKLKGSEVKGEWDRVELWGEWGWKKYGSRGAWGGKRSG